MSAHVRPTREIKTLSSVLGCGVHSDERHVHLFQLATLELERTRRSRERATAIRRIRDIDQRLAEIEAIIGRHQAALGVARAYTPVQRDTLEPAGEVTVPKAKVLRYGS